MNFLFDNNLPAPLADALRLLSKPVVHVRSIRELGAAAPDDLILDYAVRWNYALITSDRAMRRSPHFQELLRSKGLGVFFVNTGSARQLNSWQIAQLIVRSWDEIERFADSHPAPFLALVQRNARVMRI